MHSLEFISYYMFNNKMTLGLSVYKNLIDNKLIKDTIANSDRWINKNELNTYGIEVYSNCSINMFQLYTNYTYSNSYEQDGIFIPEISMHTANIGVTYSLNSNMKINLRTNYLGQRKNPKLIPSTGNDIIDDVFLLHGSVSYFDYKNFDFQLKINNILNQKYYHPSNRFAGRYRQPQRTITVKVSFNF